MGRRKRRGRCKGKARQGQAAEASIPEIAAGDAGAGSAASGAAGSMPEPGIAARMLSVGGTRKVDVRGRLQAQLQAQLLARNAQMVAKFTAVEMKLGACREMAYQLLGKCVIEAPLIDGKRFQFPDGVVDEKFRALLSAGPQAQVRVTIPETAGETLRQVLERLARLFTETAHLPKEVLVQVKRESANEVVLADATYYLQIVSSLFFWVVKFYIKYMSNKDGVARMIADYQSVARRLHEKGLLVSAVAAYSDLVQCLMYEDLFAWHDVDSIRTCLTEGRKVCRQLLTITDWSKVDLDLLLYASNRLLDAALLLGDLEGCGPYLECLKKISKQGEMGRPSQCFVEIGRRAELFLRQGNFAGAKRLIEEGLQWLAAQDSQLFNQKLSQSVALESLRLHSQEMDPMCDYLGRHGLLPGAEGKYDAQALAALVRERIDVLYQAVSRDTLSGDWKDEQRTLHKFFMYVGLTDYQTRGQWFYVLARIEQLRSGKDMLSNVLDCVVKALKAFGAHLAILQESPTTEETLRAIREQKVLKLDPGR